MPLLLQSTERCSKSIFDELKQVTAEREGREYASEKEQYLNRLSFTSKDVASYISKCGELVGRISELRLVVIAVSVGEHLDSS